MNVIGFNKKFAVIFLWTSMLAPNMLTPKDVFGFIPSVTEFFEEAQVDQIIEMASDFLVEIHLKEWPVGNERLDVSWVFVSDIHKSLYIVDDYKFIIIFWNEEENRKLYIFVDNREEYYLANFSGEFHLDRASYIIPEEGGLIYEPIKQSIFGKSQDIK